ncbi:MAG: hypothetical protein CL840_20760 [Crocinitomicaceae bacterium]|nr:hypothetical protein [Crocinitomicaceae bacterium]|tara:strand:+ start:21088 stop:22311 length:1224 start_codon:yes stop_codon:yes gene_type:complete
MSASSRTKSKNQDRFKVRRILEITTAINENKKASDLFKIFRDILLIDLEIEQVVFLALKDTEWGCVINEGLGDWKCNFDVDEELLKFKDITSLGMSETHKLNIFDLLVPVYHKKKALGFLLLKDLEDESMAVSNLIKNLNYIQSLANIIMVAIENKRMANAQLEQEGIKRELLLAERIQKALLPANLPNNENIKATAYHRSYGHVGGDYYDLLETEPGVYYICMADISGKGVSAALLMSNFQAAFKATVRQNLTLQEIVKQLNQIVTESSQGDKFITAFLGKYDSDTHELEYVNCAHPPAILFNNKMTRNLNSIIPGLGMVDNIPYFEPETYTLGPNTFLTCYTDGVVEIENVDGEQFGNQRLVTSIDNFKGKPLEEFIDHITGDIELFIGEQEANDDIAALNIEFI